MEPERFEELASLAESIAEEHFKDGKTDLLSILEKSGIILIRGNYEQFFLGNLVHESKKFYLYLNLDMLSENQNPRIRFTIAHELGHYFIDQHRNLLKKGTSLSFNKEHNNSLIEKEANHFASFLLMPKTQFINAASEVALGISGILYLANKFEASIDATSIQYIKLSCCIGLVVRWSEDNSIKYTISSQRFQTLTNSKGKPLLKQIDTYLENLKMEFLSLDNPNEIIENATPLSRWLGNISPGSPDDLTCLEQTFKLGNYGGLTLILYI